MPEAAEWGTERVPALGSGPFGTGNGVAGGWRSGSVYGQERGSVSEEGSRCGGLDGGER